MASSLTARPPPLPPEPTRLLLESIRDYAIFQLDSDGRIVSWNAGAEQIKGYAFEEVYGAHFSIFYPPEEVAAGKCERALAVAAREGRYEEEGWRRRKGGGRFWASVVLTAVRDETGALVGFAKVTRDLTERRKLEEERLRRARAEEGLRLRDEFLTVASHELRTPLTALQLQLAALRMYGGNLDARMARGIARATRSSERLADLVDTLLNVSRIAAGTLEIEPADLDQMELVRDVEDSLREAAEHAGCRIVVDGPASLVGRWDRVRIEQVLTNLLSNAMRHGGGSIEVRIEAVGDEVVLAVRDHGPGIPEEDATAIFGRFARAASSQRHGGLGLGLYVARQLVEAHGGTVTAENAPGGGARFVVRMPRVARLRRQGAARI